MKKFTETFPRGLIVSCQAREGEPLHGSDIMARMALSAEMGGAVGIRANTPEDIAAIKKLVSLPVIGIYKIQTGESEVYITPTFESAQAIAGAGADAIAIDATRRTRPQGQTLDSLIDRIHQELNLPVMADCSTVEEGIAAAGAGADVVASTLGGYTSYSRRMEEPDFELLKGLIEHTDLPVIAEGRYHTPEEAALALSLGAYAVVVGTAITRPHEITAGFVRKVQNVLE